VAPGRAPSGLSECSVTVQQQSQLGVHIQHDHKSQQQPLQPWQHQQWGSHSHQWHSHRHYRPPAAARGRRAPTPESESDPEGHRPSRGSELRLKRRHEQQEELPADVQKHWRQQWQQQQQQVQQQRYRTPQGSSRGSSYGRPGSSSNSAEDRTSRVHSRSQGRDMGSRSRGAGPGLYSRSSSAGSGIDVIGITDSISAAKSLQALQKLLQQHKEHLQQIHVCAAYKAVVKLSLGLRERTQQPQASSSGSSSSSSTGSSRDQQPADGSTALDILRQLSSRMQQQIRVARPWDLAQAAWACSKVGACAASVAVGSNPPCRTCRCLLAA